LKNNWRYPEEVRKLRFTHNHQQKVLNRINAPMKKENHHNLFYGLITAAVILFLLGSSTFFVPSMQNVFAKIPYISNFIKVKELREEETEY
jgi:hypothetical protein